MVIYGNAKPPYGPVDIVVQDGVIAYIGATSDVPASARGSNDAVIDATGKYVMPGIVNAHMHWHEERQPGIAQPIQYERNLYLAAGVTTAREVGGDFDKSKRWQAESNAHTIVAPRILVYPFVSKGRTGSPADSSTRPPMSMSNASPALAPSAFSFAVTLPSAIVAISTRDRSCAMTSLSSKVADPERSL